MDELINSLREVGLIPQSKPTYKNSNTSTTIKREQQRPQPHPIRLNKQDTEHIEKIIDKVNEALHLFGIENRFTVDNRSDEIVVKVVDTKTDKVIREIPPEDVRERIAKMKEVLGLLFDIKV